MSVWQDLISATDDNLLINILQRKYAFGFEQSSEIAAYDIKSAGYSEYSVKAIKKLTPIMGNGSTLNEAILAFYGKVDTYIKMYNIHNFPTETEADRQELFNFFSQYAENSMKPDGVVTVEFLNTAFRPSLNTPMQRLEATLYPPARYEDGRVAVGDGFVFKMSVNNRDALSHLEDLISIRYTDEDIPLVHFIATDKAYQKMNNTAKMQAILSRWNIEKFTRRYDLDEYLPSDLVLTGLNMKKQEEILRKKLFI